MITEETKQLQLEFIGKGQVRGFKFTQINQSLYGFLYKVDSGNSIYYEVFRKRLNTQYNCISYPSDKSFGIWAWTTPSFNKAVDMFNNLDRFETKEVDNG